MGPMDDCVRQRRSRNPRTGRCYWCGERGHFHYDKLTHRRCTNPQLVDKQRVQRREQKRLQEQKPRNQPQSPRASVPQQAGKSQSYLAAAEGLINYCKQRCDAAEREKQLEAKCKLLEERAAEVEKHAQQAQNTAKTADKRATEAETRAQSAEKTAAEAIKAAKQSEALYMGTKEKCLVLESRVTSLESLWQQLGDQLEQRQKHEDAAVNELKCTIEKREADYFKQMVARLAEWQSEWERKFNIVKQLCNQSKAKREDAARINVNGPPQSSVPVSASAPQPTAKDAKQDLSASDCASVASNVSSPSPLSSSAQPAPASVSLTPRKRRATELRPITPSQTPGLASVLQQISATGRGAEKQGKHKKKGKDSAACKSSSGWASGFLA